MCGEKLRPDLARICRVGSPPRVRGKVRSADIGRQGGRITPACAGKSVCRSGIARIAGDHPRVCGEKTIRRHKRLIQKGSPPRVRGKARATSSPPYIYRITPACAGKRVTSIDAGQSLADHPRVCGEKGHRTGSGCKKTGITPACAGKRHALEGFSESKKDHPRVCGEKFQTFSYLLT